MTNLLHPKEQALPEAKRLGGGQLIIIILIFIILGGGGLAYWYFDRASRSGGVSLKGLPPQERLNPEEIQKLLKTVGKLILLPEGEPLIAAIQDASSLKQAQPFFASSENGDQLLVYADKAFIYRPSADKLINVGPVYRADNPDQTAAVAASEAIQLEFRNGSRKTGAARALADQLAGLSGYAIAQITNAATSTYDLTEIFNLTGKNISPIQQQLGLANSAPKLPPDEAASAADAVVIVGNDRVE